jgi:hypothetical protein
MKATKRRGLNQYSLIAIPQHVLLNGQNGILLSNILLLYRVWQFLTNIR